MRSALILLPTLAIAMGACSIAVGLEITNHTTQTVTIRMANQTWVLRPNESRLEYSWPDNRVIWLSIGNCFQGFNLDEKYLPGNEWKYSATKLVRRYSINPAGNLQIDVPDRNHAEQPHDFRSSGSDHVDLTVVGKDCPALK